MIKKRTFLALKSIATLTVLCFIPVFFPALSHARSSTPESLFYEANRYYTKGDYEQAIQVYKRIIESGYEGGNLYFNLGNCYFKLGKKGMAILYYEKAKRLIPGDADLKANLSYALTNVNEGKRNWKIEALSALAYISSLEQLCVNTSVSFFLLAGLLIFYILFPKRVKDAETNKLRMWWLAATSIAVVVFLVFLSLAVLAYMENARQYAVAVKEGGIVRFEPNKQATLHYELSEGTRVQVLKEKDAWYLVKRRDGLRGWVEKIYLEKI